jgi:hypothetical protein
VWIDPWSRRGVDKYYVVIAVDKEGRGSKISNIVKILYPLEKPGKVDKSTLQENQVITFNTPKDIKEGPAPDAPSKLSAIYDVRTGRVQLKWKASSTPGIVGYRIKAADINPNKMRGNHIYLENSPKDQNLHIHTGDMIFLDKQMRDWDLDKMSSNRMYDIGRNYPKNYFKPTENSHWKLVDHPGPVPSELAKSGQSCIQIDIDGEERVDFKYYCYAGTDQNWYKVLDPDKTYIVEFWAKQSNIQNSEITFSMPGPFRREIAIAPVKLEIGENWKLHRFEIKVPVK